jgi:hypothetical protein
LGKSFLEKMEISEPFFGKNHEKLAHFQNLSPKIIYVSMPKISTDWKSILLVEYSKNSFACELMGGRIKDYM